MKNTNGDPGKGQAAASASADGAAKKKILIVDDDTFLLDMYALKFKNKGFEVVTSASGMDAMAKLKKDGYRPDIIVVDIVMPQMDGFELVQNIHKEFGVESKAVIILLTNQSQSSDIEKAKKLGVHGYIVKASSIPSEVVDEVEKIYKANS